MTASIYAAHPLRELVDRALALRDDPLLFDPAISANEPIAFARDKAFVAIEAVKTKLGTTPALAVSVQGLANLTNGVQGVFNELTAFISNRNPGHITNAGSHADGTVWPYMWAFGGGEGSEPLRLAVASIDALNVDVTKTIAELVAQRDKLTADVGAMTQALKAQEDRLVEMTATIAAQKADAAAVTTVVQAAYVKEASERETAFNANSTQMSTAFADAMKKYAEDASGILKKLDESKTEAAKIVGVVGNIGVTGNYQKIANAEDKSAVTWRLVTIGFFLVAIGVAVATFVEFWKEPVASNVWAIAVRLLYAIALAAPAWYTAKESARHRTNSDRARQFELELASLGPFIELLPQDKKDAIREEMTKRYFGKEVAAHENAPLITGQDLASIANKAIDALAKQR